MKMMIMRRRVIKASHLRRVTRSWFEIVGGKAILQIVASAKVLLAIHEKPPADRLLGQTGAGCVGGCSVVRRAQRLLARVNGDAGGRHCRHGRVREQIVCRDERVRHYIAKVGGVHSLLLTRKKKKS